MIMILLILTVVWFTNSDSIQSAREFIQNNIYVWSETQEEKLPIYCVDTDKQRIATIYEEGHDIASHGDHHKYMTKLTDKQQQEEIQGVTQKIQGLLGIKIDLFRAPYGDYNESVVRNARKMNYYMIQWNVDSLDWQEPTKEQLIKKVCEHKNLSPGSIILMHTGTKCTKQALKQIIRNIKAKGYEFVPVSRLIYRSNYRIDPTGKQIKL